MRRIVIIGPGGAGKSTLARQVGARLGLPVVHLDACYWRAGWAEPPKDAWARTVDALVREEAWVMDGNFGGTLEMRLAAADTAILLDLPPLVCLWRVARRRLRYRGRSRPDMANGCPEKLDLDFLLWIARYRSASRPRALVRLAAAEAAGTRVVVLRSRRAVARFIASLPPGA